MNSAAVSASGGHARGRFPSIRSRQPTPWAVILVVFTCFLSRALAATANPPAPYETLVIDQRAPYWDGERWILLSEHELQKRRMVDRDNKSTDSSHPSATSSGSISVTSTFSIAVGSPTTTTSSSTSVAPSPLPSILDSLSSDFAPGPNGGPAPCPLFINSFLSDPTFKSCYPLSMLFDSQSFFEAQKSLVGITRTLDATCAANATSCTQYMAQLAQNLTSTSNCGLDLQRGTQSVVDAYNEMLAYAPIYSAGCLKDPNTGAYCYATAVTNLTNPSMSFFYFLPLNRTLPGSTVPSCNYCLQQTMALYQADTADRRQDIALTYVGAAKQVNTICGPGFVNETLAAASGAAAGRLVARSSAWMAASLPLLAAVLWLV